MNKIDTSELFAHYPHIAAKIKALWGTKECRVLLMSLMNDSRGGTRAGFPLSIGKIIISLLQAHDESFPQFDNKNDAFIPFTGVRSRPVVARQQSDWGMIGAIAKLIALVLIAAIFYKVYKNL